MKVIDQLGQVPIRSDEDRGRVSTIGGHNFHLRIRYFKYSSMAEYVSEMWILMASNAADSSCASIAS